MKKITSIVLRVIKETNPKQLKNFKKNIICADQNNIKIIRDYRGAILVQNFIDYYLPIELPFNVYEHFYELIYKAILMYLKNDIYKFLIENNTIEHIFYYIKTTNRHNHHKINNWTDFYNFLIKNQISPFLILSYMIYWDETVEGRNFWKYKHNQLVLFIITKLNNII